MDVLLNLPPEPLCGGKEKLIINTQLGKHKISHDHSYNYSYFFKPQAPKHCIFSGMVSAHLQIITTMSCTVEDSHGSGKEMEGSVAYVEMPGICLW